MLLYYYNLLIEYFVLAVFSNQRALFIMACIGWQAILYFLDVSFVNPFAQIVWSGT